jgi:hypothetical protein
VGNRGRNPLPAPEPGQGVLGVPGAGVGGLALRWFTGAIAVSEGLRLFRIDGGWGVYT